MPTIDFLWDGWSDNVLQETDENNVVTTYFQRPEKYGEVLYHKAGSRFSFYHFDGNGSTRKLTNVSQSTIKTFIFSGFGELVASNGTGSTPFAYKGAAGYYTNPVTNDIYVRARAYDPTTGRWLSKDPLGFVDGPNLFRAYFVPIDTDPSGMIVLSVFKKDFHGDCDGDEVSVTFEIMLDHPAKCDGYVIQKVTNRCHYKVPCCDSLESKEIEYWEAFPVKEGDLFPRVDEGKYVNNQHFDVSSCSFRGAGYLKIVQLGVLKFFCKSDLNGQVGMDVSAWKRDSVFEHPGTPCKVTPWFLRGSLDRPVWWSEKSETDVHEIATRWFLAEFECCDGIDHVWAKSSPD